MIILDTCLLFAVYNKDDQNHKNAKSIFKRIFAGEYAQPILIDYVYNELLTLTYIKTKNFDLCIQISTLLNEFISKQIITFLHTPSEIFWKANQIFLDQNIQEQKRVLSFVDSIIGAMSNWLNVTFIATFDTQFHQFNAQIISK